MEGLDVTEGLRRIALAGVGAVAMGAERGEEAVDELVRRGERAVDQGKALNQELTHRARQAADDAATGHVDVEGGSGEGARR